MYSQNIRGGDATCLRSLKPARRQFDSQPLACIWRRLQWVGGQWLVPVLLLLIAAMVSTRANAQPAPPASDRITINLSQGVPNFVGNAAAADPNAALPQSNWWYENNQDSTAFATTG